ncbi:MAG: YncE family protein [Gemmatimonadales bacterium]|nr:MAG: YncE family protein [Gemmatimonadales bacterium]
METHAAGLVCLTLLLGACAAMGRADDAAGETDGPSTRAGEQPPTAEYRVYVGSESADSLHLIRFGEGGAEVEQTLSLAQLYRTTTIRDRFTESEAPHGLASGGGFLYMTTGHGIPDGKLWKIDPELGESVGNPVDLGRFPASLDVTPDGRFVFVVNFNLHGEMLPSSVSVVFAPDMVEVARTETCTMPHGSRVNSRGTHHYSVCMMDDELVEIDVRTFAVSRRFSLAAGREGPIVDDHGHHPDPTPHAGVHGTHGAAASHDATCSPTWAQPAPDGGRIWVACNRSDEILEIDVESWRLLRRFSTGRGPYNLEATPDGRLLVVTLKQGDGVELIDLVAGGSIRRIESSTRVSHGVTISPDGRYAFVSVEGIGAEPGKVDIYDLDTLHRAASVPVGLQASGITFWTMESP